MTNTGCKFVGTDRDSTDPFKLGDDYITRTQSCCHLGGNLRYRTKLSPSKLKKRLSTEGSTRGSSVASYPLTTALLLCEEKGLEQCYVKCDDIYMQNVADKQHENIQTVFPAENYFTLRLQFDTIEKGIRSSHSSI